MKILTIAIADIADYNTKIMTQKFFYDDEPPQPYPSDLINILKEEEKKERAPKCTCENPPEDGCLC